MQRPNIAVQKQKSGVQKPKNAVQDPNIAVQRQKSAVQKPKNAVQKQKNGVQEPNIAVQDPNIAVQEPNSDVQPRPLPRKMVFWADLLRKPDILGKVAVFSIQRLNGDLTLGARTPSSANACAARACLTKTEAGINCRAARSMRARAPALPVFGSQ